MNKVEKIIRYALSQHPVKTGMRFLSDRELAEMLGVNRMKIHRTMGDLVDEGVAARFHGSGTFVRKVFKQEDVESLVLTQKEKKLAQHLFAEPSTTPGRVFPRQGLCLALWSDFKLENQPDHLVIDGIVERAKDLHHEVSLHTLAHGNADPRNAEDIAEELKSNPADGFLVVTRWASLFEQAFAIAHGNIKPPTSYIYLARHPTVFLEPLIDIDDTSAVARAVNIFATEGYRRIAVIAIEDRMRPVEWRKQSIKFALNQCGLSYESFLLVAPEKMESVAYLLDQLLKGAAPPDAIYVSNDHLMPKISAYLDATKIIPGRDLGIITLSNQGIPLPKTHNWSRLEFTPKAVGKLALDSLLGVITTAGEEMCSFSQQPIWIPGNTHTHK